MAALPRTPAAQGEPRAPPEELARLNDQLREKVALLRLAGSRQAFQLELARRLRSMSAPDKIMAVACDMLGAHLGAARVFFSEEAGPDRGPADAADAAIGPCATLAIPLVLDGRVGVILHLESVEARHWLPDDIRLARHVAEWAWSAAENACTQAALRAEREQAADALRNIDRRKDEFLAMLAHELRNPLAPIVTAAGILRRPDVDPAAIRRIASLIERQTTHMAAMLADLLDVSRINMGLVALRREPLALQAVLADAIEQTKPLMELRSHRFALRVPQRALRVEGDANRLVQIFANILNNAAKYTPEGGAITVVIEASGARAVARVTDTGVGMGPELLPHVFEMFSQAERSADRHVGGLGLGLSLVKNLVLLHGGVVAARSPGLGLGSEITVTLPLLEDGHEPAMRILSTDGTVGAKDPGSDSLLPTVVPLQRLGTASQPERPQA